MRITMTKAEALKIQAEHIAWYAKIYGPDVPDLVKAASKAHLLDDGVQYDIFTINAHIPRGGFIERLIPAKMVQEYRGR